MVTRGTEPAELSYLSGEQLYVGVFVVLDIPWFKHDFTLNSFKVRNAEQLAELRGLKLARYQFDPLRSDPMPQDQATAAPVSTAEEEAEAKAQAAPSVDTSPASMENTAGRSRSSSVGRAWRRLSGLLSKPLR